MVGSRTSTSQIYGHIRQMQGYTSPPNGGPLHLAHLAHGVAASPGTQLGHQF